MFIYWILALDKWQIYKMADSQKHNFLNDNIKNEFENGKMRMKYFLNYKMTNKFTYKLTIQRNISIKSKRGLLGDWDLNSTHQASKLCIYMVSTIN